MIRYILLIITLIFSLSAIAQNPTKILIANEGYMDFTTGEQVIKPSIGVYDIQTESYQVIEEIEGSGFTSDIEVDGAYFYVAADNKVLKYDISSFERIASLDLEGARKLAFHENQMLVTRGDFGVTFDHYFQSYNKNDFTLLYELNEASGVKYSTEDIAIYEGKAYFAMNNAFEFPDYKALVGVVNLTTNGGSFERDFFLGTNGSNPDYLTINNGKIYTLNNQDFSTSSVSQISLSDEQITTNDLLTAGGCGSSLFANGKLHYQVSGDDQIQSYDFDQNSTLGTILAGKSIYGLHHETNSNIFWAGVTDFVSSGTLISFNEQGTILNEINVGVSPGNIAFVYESNTNINNIESNLIAINPNPFTEGFKIEAENIQDIREVIIRDQLGRIVATWDPSMNNAYVNSSDWIAGMYLVEYKFADNSFTSKIIKQ